MQRYFGTAVGKGRQAAKTEIERLKLGEISSEQGVVEVAKMYGPSVPTPPKLMLHLQYNRMCAMLVTEIMCFLQSV